MSRFRFAGTLAIGLMLLLVVTGNARAQSRLIQGSGGTVDNDDEWYEFSYALGFLESYVVPAPPFCCLSYGDIGTIGLAGQITFINGTNPTSVDIALTYQDDAGDGFTCTYTSPSDVTLAGGTLTLTVGASDSCIRTYAGSTISDNVGKQISFKAFGNPSTGWVFVGKSINLIDAFGDNILEQTVVGALK